MIISILLALGAHAAEPPMPLIRLDNPRPEPPILMTDGDRLDGGELLPADKIILDGAPEAPRTQITEFKCGDAVLRITADDKVLITHNDKPLTGPKATILIAELSHRGAVYRLDGSCLTEVGKIGLNVVRGERGPGQPVTYWQSYYGISANAEVINYTGLMQLEADSFW